MLSRSPALVAPFPSALMPPDGSIPSISPENYNFGTNANRPKIRPRNPNQITTIQVDSRANPYGSQRSENHTYTPPIFPPFPNRVGAFTGSVLRRFFALSPFPLSGPRQNRRFPLEWRLTLSETICARHLAYFILPSTLSFLCAESRLTGWMNSM